MKVAIIIPNWNGEEKLRQNLPSVLEAARAGGVDEVIVSDDASSDNSVEVLEKEFPSVRILKRKSNGGFSTNVNFAFKHTEADLVVLLNSDVQPAKDFLMPLVKHFKNPRVFSVGCNSGGSFAIAKFKNGYFWHNQSSLIPKEPHPTLWASGGSSIFKKNIWDLLGGLDSLYDPFYEEDLDIGYRATKRGFINLWDPRSKVTHNSSEGVIAQNFTKMQINKAAQRNQLIFIWKNIHDRQFILQHIRALVVKAMLHPKYILVIASALRSISEIRRKRDLEVKQSVVSDKEILKSFS